MAVFSLTSDSLDSVTFVGSGIIVNGLVAPGTVVYLLASANSGHVFDNWQVTSGNANIISASSPNTSFTMPHSNVSIVANFRVDEIPQRQPTQGEFSVSVRVNSSLAGDAWPEIFTVSGSTHIYFEGPNGEIVRSLQTTPGSAVYLVAEASSGHIFDNWQVISGNVTLQVNFNNGFTSTAVFTMPDGNVSVVAHFRNE
jgi:hypothetical protein